MSTFLFDDPTTISLPTPGNGPAIDPRVAAHYNDGTVGMVPAYSNPAVDGDGVQVRPNPEVNGTHRYTGANQTFEVESHVQTVGRKGWNRSDKDFTFSTRLSVQPQVGGTFDDLHNSTVEKPLVWARFPVKDLENIFQAEITRNLDRFIAPVDGETLNMNLMSLFIEAIVVRQRDSGGSRVPIAVVLVEEKKNAAGASFNPPQFEPPKSVFHRTWYGANPSRQALDIVYPRGSGPAADKLFDLHHMKESNVAQYYTRTDLSKYLENLSKVTVGKSTYYLVPSTSPLLQNTSTDPKAPNNAIVLETAEEQTKHTVAGVDYHYVPEAKIAELEQDRTTVTRAVNAINAQNAVFVFVRADGRAGAEDKYAGTPYSDNGGKGCKAPPADNCLFVPGFDLEIAFRYDLHPDYKCVGKVQVS